MTDFINRIISIIISFVILIMGSMTMLALANELTAKRTILNEVSNLIDKVEDTGELTDSQLADFYLAVNTSGITSDATIERYMKVVNPTDYTGAHLTTSYVKVDEVTSYNKGDLIKVNVKAVDYTGAQRLLWMILKVFDEKIDISMSGVVEND